MLNEVKEEQSNGDSMLEDENKEPSVVEVAVIVEVSFQTEDSEGFSLDYI